MHALAVSFHPPHLRSPHGCGRSGNAYPSRTDSGTAVDSSLELPDGLSWPSPGRWTARAARLRHREHVVQPGWLHTGEDWYLPEAETGGMGVYAAAAGEVVFAGSEYPGLVVIVEHPDGLYSMYGHLDYALAVEAGSIRRARSSCWDRSSPAATVWPRVTSTSRCAPSSPARGERERAPLRRRLRLRLPAWSRLLANRPVPEAVQLATSHQPRAWPGGVPRHGGRRLGNRAGDHAALERA